ncbi:EpsD family peptidyl-prolyl cis-trans isomerase [Xylophilus sp. GOD-11R]|uniref:EpsD family peptidyl-prolyl cis-trans isomerase n=1 Tax=Xylophilus sp. GOD-11R TaxID=3089814 RepID=UPI00298D5C37|nr:EpsD family peptidyl-prolyl cis-trans isomerase [Xylophilus sp. GOD-11R]WPB57919.1 EpsD family peptidyl-prolyl cis-trans isomerase [Xylophilus sp. GOD-11R]
MLEPLAFWLKYPFNILDPAKDTPVQPHPAPNSFRPIMTRCAAVAFLFVISACSGKNAPESQTQVAAKVDNTEISLHQINYLLTRANANPGSPEAAASLKRQVLEKLIDQQLLVQKSIEDKLDRSPDVQMALENARKDVLAEAYLKAAAASNTKPSDKEVNDYYINHPELFAKRRVFQFTEFNVPRTADKEAVAAAIEGVEAGRTSEDVAKILQGRGVNFASTESARSSEQISLDILPKLYRIRQGQGIVSGNEQMVTMVFVKNFQEAPVAENVAGPRIAQFLANQSVSQNVSALVKSLRSKSQISYLGEFSEPVPTPAK